MNETERGEAATAKFGHLELPRSVDNLVHCDAHMAFLVDTFSVPDEQDLRGFVVDAEGVGYFIGYRPVADEVQVVKINGGGWLISFQPAFDEGAGGAAGTVLENELRAVCGFFPDLI